MQVAKLTAHDGREFFSDELSADALQRVAARLGGLRQVDILEMSNAEYQAIPATNESAAIFQR